MRHQQPRSRSRRKSALQRVTNNIIRQSENPTAATTQVEQRTWQHVNMNVSRHKNVEDTHVRRTVMPQLTRAASSKLLSDLPLYASSHKFDQYAEPCEDIARPLHVAVRCCLQLNHSLDNGNQLSTRSILKGMF